MKKEHFEILLEEMKSNFQLAFEGLDGVNGRLDKVDGRLDTFESRLDGIDRLEAGLEVVKTGVRDMNRNQGLLNSIANDHESRIQGIESQLKDHIDNHS